ncbi:leucine zipper domain-containing protein [Nocardia sp. NRRL S-836]|uniref:leucine zipper domain-containing protein n=1 Tax=Nocardia sp. NRRL S-836 TaxID=1519492 RepID=UPI0009E862BC
MGISRATVHKWPAWHRPEGGVGLADRSSQPRPDTGRGRGPHSGRAAGGTTRPGGPVRPAGLHDRPDSARPRRARPGRGRPDHRPAGVPPPQRHPLRTRPHRLRRPPITPD